MVNVSSTVTIESVPGSTFSVHVTCDEEGLVKLVVKGRVLPVNVQCLVSEDQEEADDAAGPEHEEEEGEEAGQDINAPFIRLLGLILDRTYRNCTTAVFVYSLVPNLTYLAFAARYIERVEEENAAWPSLKEMRVYYSLYRAKHGGTGPYHEIIEQAREGEVEGEESDEAFRFLLGLFLNQHHDREHGIEIVDSLPQNLTYPLFQAAYAREVRSLLGEAAPEWGKGGYRTTTEERGAYWHLYKAYNGEDGKYMEMIQEARGGQVLGQALAF